MTNHRVGPAPATPDEGEATIRAISDDMYAFRAQRDEARAALAAAEAERDGARQNALDEDAAARRAEKRAAAYAAELDRALRMGEILASRVDAVEELLSNSDLTVNVHALRRALSVEAAGTKGGGGHE